MTDIYEQLQTEADVEAEKIRPTKEESSLYGAKWLTVEDLLTDDKGYSKFAVDSAKAGGGGTSDFTTAKVKIVNNSSKIASFQMPWCNTEDGKTYVWGGDTLVKNSENEYDVIVSTGTTLFCTDSSNSFNIAATGNADVINEHQTATISGDCVITLTDYGK